MLRALWAPYTLRFRETAITSRASMQTKDTYLIKVYDDSRPAIAGWGECPLFRGLSAEDTPEYESQLYEACDIVSGCASVPRREDERQKLIDSLPAVSSIRFGFEMALNDLASGGQRTFFDTPWRGGECSLPINGLIWMGDRDTMARRIGEKLSAGFHCVKLKIGGINFEDELELLRTIRKSYGPEDIELRVDANGAFTPENAPERLERLAEFNIHSIEQPIRAGQWSEMARLVKSSPIDIALDEELIGFSSDDRKKQLLDEIHPQYIILKPALCGGFRESDLWIELAEERGIGWWATSALESDLGLSAIGQWVSGHNPSMPQGLGTGQLYTNNFPSPVSLKGDRLSFSPGSGFEFPELTEREYFVRRYSPIL